MLVARTDMLANRTDIPPYVLLQAASRRSASPPPSAPPFDFVRLPLLLLLVHSTSLHLSRTKTTSKTVGSQQTVRTGREKARTGTVDVLSRIGHTLRPRSPR